MSEEKQINKSKNWFARHKIITTTVVILILPIIVDVLNGEEDTNQANNNQNKNITVQTKIDNTNIEDVLVTINYEIVGEEDISYKDVKRYNVRVVISNNPATKQQVQTVSEKIVKDYRVKSADAVVIFYYFDKTQVDGAYTLAKAEWAPNGDWSQANLKKDQKLTYQYANFIDKERKDEPTPLEREINQVMRDKWYELAETNISVTDEDVAIILAPEYNKSVEEMLEIRTKVSNYDLGI